jgi:hypothetical protein
MSGAAEAFAIASPALGEEMRGYVVQPADDPVALVYLLHGRGGAAEDWLPVLAGLALPPLVAVLPDAPWSERASWYVDSAAADGKRSRPHVWNLTESEHRDGRVRFAILKGGSAYRAGGSDWYFDGGEQPAGFSAKLVLPGAGLARSSQIGFRCAVELRTLD